MNGKNIFPMIIAAIIALIITFAVRYFLPNPSGGGSAARPYKELSMPEIPLMVDKEVKKKKEHQVLTIAKDIRKDDKITNDMLVWKKWPEDMVQPNFIAKDEKGRALNNPEDFNKALTMWAKSDIPSGSPITLYMLTSEDPAIRIDQENKRKKEEETKKIQKEIRESFIKPGMRAISFPIDQRSASASHMIKPGDLIDVLIMEQKGDSSRTYKYKAMKILALDGVTELEYKKKHKDGEGILESVGGGNSTPKVVTLEVKENMVETLLKQSERNGLILSIRNQSEEITEDEDEKSEEETVATVGGIEPETEEKIVKSMIEAGNKSVIKAMQDEFNEENAKKNKNNVIVDTMNQMRSSSPITSLKQAEEEEKRETTEQDRLKKQNDALMSSLSNIGKDGNREALKKEQTEKESTKMLMSAMRLLDSNSPRSTLAEEKGKTENINDLMNVMNSFGGSSMASGVKQRVAAGRNFGGDEENSVTIYRKLTSTGVEFDDEGKVTTGKSNNGAQ